MDRTTAPYYATIAGKRAYQDPNPGAGILIGTGLTAADRQATQEEIMAVIEGSGLTGSAGDLTQLYQAIGRMIGAGTRVRLTANTAFYVNTSGSDTTGLGTISAPWATMQHAVNVLMQYYDLCGFTPVIKVSGTHTSIVTVAFLANGQNGPIVFDGQGSATVVNATAGLNCFNVSNSGWIQVINFALISNTGAVISGSGCGLACNGLGTLWHSGNTFGVSSAHIAAWGAGASITATGNYTIAGSAPMGHVTCGNLSNVQAQPINGCAMVTLIGTPSFATNGFAVAQGNGMLIYTTSFSGAATGPRFTNINRGQIYTNGGGINYFPGNAAGVTDPLSAYY